ncbi:MAG: hypothetical protein ACREQ5_12975 [Candidatus Dormibacteria bacterium]
MIIAPTRARFAFAGRRLDAAYFCSPGVRAAEVLALLRKAAVPMPTIASDNSLGSVFHPNRFKRQLAASAEEALPFLRAFDVFEYLPQPADWISVKRTDKLDSLRVNEGVILLTRSGRNLGPAVMVDAYLAKFIPSDDLLRVRIDDERMRNYAFAFLNSTTGQNLLRQDKTGSVIDHLSGDQVAQQCVPVLENIVDDVADDVRKTLQLRETARLTLAKAVTDLESTVYQPRGKPARDGWAIPASALCGRLDAAFYDEGIAQLRSDMLKTGGVRLGDVATVRKPAGRYKTYYVDAEHGRPLLSGRNLLQMTPIGLKHIAERSIPSDSGYEVRAGWTCFQADGRAEERLGYPVIVTSERSGWLASGHVARVAPMDGIEVGWIWTAIASKLVQRQMAGLACGSVVDALYEDDLRNLVLPLLPPAEGPCVATAWEMFAESNALEAVATGRIESEISKVLAM